MTRDEALKLLRGGTDGVSQWNRARAKEDRRPIIGRLDFQRIDLAHKDLTGVDLSRIIVYRANFDGANLRDAKMDRASLVGARFGGANLIGASLAHADAHFSIFTQANLSGADLRGVNLSYAKFDYANLTDASLVGAIFEGTKLSATVFQGAYFGGTIVAADFSQAKGLESTRHVFESSIAVDSLRQFQGDLPQAFLRGCGLRDEEIAYFRSVVGKPIRFYSCFISYSTKDEEFASRLHNDFQAKGIRCWKWDHDARTGRSMWGEIDQAIRVHDKVVLIASESSLKSPAVNREIERAIQEEDRRMKDKQAGRFDGDLDVLFPVRVDDFIFDEWQHERKADVVKKVIADARNWDKDPAVYAKVRDKLIKDLKPQ